MPQRRMAWGACSRDDPQPKLALTSSTVLPAYAGLDTGWAWGRPASAWIRSSSNRCCSSPSNEIDLRNLAGMIRSVSMLSPRSGIAVPRISTIFSMDTGGDLPDVDDLAGHRGSGDHRRAHEQGPSGRTPLPALEVTIRRGGADLAAFKAIRVHRQAHRTAGAAPVEAGLDEHAVQPFLFSGQPHRLGSRHRQRPPVRRDVAAPHQPGGFAQVRQT